MWHRDLKVCARQKNERGDRLFEFCKKNQFVATLVISNRREEDIWKSPGDQIKKIKTNNLIILLREQDTETAS